MADDKRLYARLTLDFADHPKIAALSDRAFRELIEAILWSRRLLTDGEISERMVPKLFSPDALAELTTNDPVKPSLIRTELGYRLHDFAEHQTTREVIEQKRAAGAAGGRARAVNRSGSLAPATDQLKQNASETLAKTETETETLSTDVERVPRKRGSRLPEPFMVTREMRLWAAERSPSVNLERATEKFVNHWRSATGRTATKLDWTAAWRTWMLNEEDRAPRGNGQIGTRAQQNLSVVEHFAQREIR